MADSIEMYSNPLYLCLPYNPFEAFAISRRNSEHYYGAELCRINSELLMDNVIRHSNRRLDAERWLLRAVRFTHSRDLRTRELRAGDESNAAIAVGQ